MTVELLKKYNAAYRKGTPLVSDVEYDRLIEELRETDPENEFLHRVEPEKMNKIEVRHPVPMLSTEKAYSQEALERFVNRVRVAAKEVGIENPMFKVTAKLDGLAGRDDGKVLSTRGNGTTGYDITDAYTKGVCMYGGCGGADTARGGLLGEIVMSKSYFEKNLKGHFEHPRNVVVGIITADTLNKHAKKALEDKAVCFVAYAYLPMWTGTGESLLERVEEIREKILGDIDYPVDGMVAEVLETKIKNHMGSTNHHNRWQIALKTKGETAETEVQSMEWQVGRTGNITPVMIVDPVKISGATIRRVTAHNAGIVRDKGIGAGARIQIIRSGEVIPKLEKVITGVDVVSIPLKCPVCGYALKWVGDFKRCENYNCAAKAQLHIRHWFKTIGNADGFGQKAISKMAKVGCNTIERVYTQSKASFEAMGFGPGQAKNLRMALSNSKTSPIDDYRFLAAFGVEGLGLGESRKILAEMRLTDIENVTWQRLVEIPGFAEKSSKSIVRGIRSRRATIHHMLGLGFCLRQTPLASEMTGMHSQISGQGIVFTGKMQTKPRKEMEEEARSLGARVQSSVTKNTNILVYGDKVGITKTTRAEKFDVRILTEQEYLAMIK